MTSFLPGTNAEDWHVKRRKEILSKYPELSKLQKSSYLSAFVFPSCSVAIFCWYVLGAYNLNTIGSAIWWVLTVFLVSPLRGGLSLQGSHETSHRLVGKGGKFVNFVVGIFCCLPSPTSAGLNVIFRAHKVHHRNAFVNNDPDTLHLRNYNDLAKSSLARRRLQALSKSVETLYKSPYLLLKGFICTPLQLSLSVLGFYTPKEIDYAKWAHHTFYFCFMAVFGVRPVMYMLLTDWMIPIDPLHKFGEIEHFSHFDHQPSYSQYNWLLNLLSFNYGYHCEHHDFPRVPWFRLPEIKRRAPAYYETTGLSMQRLYADVLWDSIPMMNPNFLRLEVTEED